MSGIEKEICNACGRKVSFGTLYIIKHKIRYKNLCSWCNTNHKKGKKFNPKTKKWVGEVVAEKKREKKLKLIKWRFENHTMRSRHFLGGQKESKDLNSLSVSRLKAMESFFLED